MDDVSARRVHNAVNNAAFILQEAGIMDGHREARALAAWVLGVEHMVFAPRLFSESEYADFMAAVGARHRHVPLQHIMRAMNFRHLTLESRPGVFVVRPETEYMVGAVLDYCRDAEHAVHNHADTPGNTPQTWRVLDLCTGSGAIALALATEHPGMDITAVDISDEAIDLATCNRDALAADERPNAGRCASPSAIKNNAPRRGTAKINDAQAPNFLAQGASRVKFMVKDIREPNFTSEIARNGGFDIVVSNPPYVPQGDVTQAEALADPHIALFGGGIDGMAMPKTVIDIAAAVLKPGAVLFMEHAPTQAEALVGYATLNGMVHAHANADLTGRNRWLYAQKK